MLKGPPLTTDATRRVCFFHGSLGAGGAERATVNLLSGIRARGWEPTVLVGRSGGVLDSAIPAGISLESLDSGRALSMFIPMRSYLREHRFDFDIIVSNLVHTNLIAYMAHRLSGSKAEIVVGLHGVLSNQIKDSKRRSDMLLPAMYRFIASGLDAIVTVSNGAADDFARTTRIPRNKIWVIHNPILTPQFEADSRKPVYHRFFQEKDAPIFVAAGRLAPVKDFATLISAFAIFRKTRSGRLIILGEGPLRPTIEAQISSLGLESDVDLPGFVTNPAAYIRRASVFLSSSRHESFGNVIVEALGVGTPVISTDCPVGPAELLDNGKYGTLVPVADPSAMAAAMLTVLEAPRQPERLRGRAAEFSMDTAADAYIRLFNEIMERKRKCTR